MISDQDIVSLVAHEYRAGQQPVICARTASLFTNPEDPSEIEAMYQCATSQFGAIDSLWDQFLSANRERYDRYSNLCKTDVTVLREEEFREVFSKDNFGRVIRDRYPESNGFGELSSPAVEGERMLVYFAHLVDELDCTGDILLIEKRSEGWRISGKITCWES